MESALEEARRHANETRYLPGQRAGHYQGNWLSATA
jgi:hypothetical protein